MKYSTWTRRDFLGRVVATSAFTIVPGSKRQIQLSSDRVLESSSSVLMGDDLTKQIAMKAIDVARSAGAHYADVRLTRTVCQEIWKEPVQLDPGMIDDTEYLAIGVRACVDGAWGFASCSDWSIDNAVQLAREAVAQATVNSRVVPQRREMGQYPAADGEWRMPLGIDPLSIPVEEKIDFLKAYEALLPQVKEHGIAIETERYQNGASRGGWRSKFTCQRQERILATTDGGFCKQLVYATGGIFPVRLKLQSWKLPNSGPEATVYARHLQLSGSGWELFLNARLDKQIPQLISEAAEWAALPTKPVDVGRYTVVCDAACAAALLDATVGTATELDRAMGDEANAVGSSYLGPDPLAVLGSQVASPIVSVSANRSAPNGLATVRWDAEGVQPKDFSLITAGVLNDYQTTRDQADQLSSWYQKSGRQVRSNGCAGAESASNITMQQRPNLILEPGKEKLGFDDLVASTTKGLAFIGGEEGSVATDFQAKHGNVTPRVREIVNGKLGARISDASALFDSSQLWKDHIIGIGGRESVEMYPGTCQKGQPSQKTLHSISAVPVMLKEMSVYDVRRKA